MNFNIRKRKIHHKSYIKLQDLASMDATIDGRLSENTDWNEINIYIIKQEGS